LGHQKKILLAIKRVKDIINGKGKWVPSNFQQYQQHILPQVNTKHKNTKSKKSTACSTHRYDCYSSLFS
jgi:hypothetical protein